MNAILTWAQRWAIPAQALADLHAALGMLDAPAPVADTSMSEAGVQARVRLQASKLGMRLWRNNVGAVHDPENGVYLRYGLANDSKQMNTVLKSGDLVGVRTRVIQPCDVGQLFGQFVSMECKHAGWKYTGTEREVAQANWAALITSLGGEARFISDAGQL